MLSLEAQIERKRKARKIVRLRTLMATGFGFIPFPILDAAGILAIQLWMIRDLAKLYGIPFKKQLAQSLIGSLVSNVGTVGALKLIPGLGSLLGGGAVAVSGGAATYALGKIFTQHFDQGGTLLSFDPIRSQAYFKQLYEESKSSVHDLKKQTAGEHKTPYQASTLKETNEELKRTVAALQQQLEQDKVGQTSNTPPKDSKKRRFRWLLLLLFFIVAGATAYWFYRAGQEPAETAIETDMGNAAPPSQALAEPEEAKLGTIDSQPPVPTDTSAVKTAGPTADDLNLTPGTAEALLADYLSDVDAGFPKTFPLEEVRFKEGTTELGEDAEAQIVNMAIVLNNYPSTEIRVYGHTDQNGRKAANRQAGYNRARVIQETLEQNGVARNRITSTYLEVELDAGEKRSAAIEIQNR